MALGGTVYAAKKARINGKAVKVKSLPGNRVKPHSIPSNRLKRAVLEKLAAVQPGQIIGAEINELTPYPGAGGAHTRSNADTAQSAIDAATAVNAVNAINAQTVNGHTAGCLPGTDGIRRRLLAELAERNRGQRARRGHLLRGAGWSPARGASAGSVSHSSRVCRWTKAMSGQSDITN